MKLITRIASLTLPMSVIVLMTITSCNTGTTSSDATSKKTTATVDKNAPHAGQIAYVNLDTLEVKYTYFKEKKAELEKKQAAMEAEITRLAQSLQNEYQKFQQKVQQGTMTQSEGEAAQQKLAAMQNNVENRRQSLGAQLLKDQQEFQEELHRRITEFIAQYNEDKGYAYILSYMDGGSILFADTAYDITKDILKGLNEQSTQQASKAADDSAQ